MANHPEMASLVDQTISIIGEFDPVPGKNHPNIEIKAITEDSDHVVLLLAILQKLLGVIIHLNGLPQFPDIIRSGHKEGKLLIGTGLSGNFLFPP
jgi:hypothetical protein